MLEKDYSAFVKGQVPAYVKGEYQTFLAFLEAYYEWMQKQGPNKLISMGEDLGDIDKTVDEFVDYFMEVYAGDIPSYILGDKRQFLKHCRDLYAAKGTANSYRLLFKILYGTDAEVLYPGEFILRASDGRWSQDKIIKAQAAVGDPFGFIGYTVTGATSGATALVENVTSYYIDNIIFYELSLSRGTVVGTFQVDETVHYNGIEVIVEPIVTGLVLTNPGVDYEKGDLITFTGGGGVYATAEVTNVDDNEGDPEFGAIRKLEMINFGYGYTGTPTPVLTATSGTGAVMTAVVGPVGTYKGNWVGVHGKLSEQAKLQDNYYYQQFSYVIKTGIAIKQWGDVVKKILHPAGMQMFGELVLQTTADLRSSIQILPFSTRLIRLICDLRDSLEATQYSLISLFSDDMVTRQFDMEANKFKFEPYMPDYVHCIVATCTPEAGWDLVVGDYVKLTTAPDEVYGTVMGIDGSGPGTIVHIMTLGTGATAATGTIHKGATLEATVTGTENVGHWDEYSTPMAIFKDIQIGNINDDPYVVKLSRDSFVKIRDVPLGGTINI